MKQSRLCWLALVLLAALPARAQTLADIERKEAELEAVWKASPLLLRNVTFVTEKAPIYGAFTPRPTNRFKSAEPLLVYMEPVGFTWKPEGEGGVFGVTLDVVLKTKDGRILGGQENFLNYRQTSRHRLRELMLNVNLTLGNPPPGDYVVEFVVKDLAAKAATVALPFTVGE